MPSDLVKGLASVESQTQKQGGEMERREPPSREDYVPAARALGFLAVFIFGFYVIQHLVPVEVARALQAFLRF